MKKFIFVLLSLIAFSTASAKTGKAFREVEKCFRRPSTVAYPIHRASYVSTNRYPYTYPYAGVALQSYTSPNTYPSEPVGVPVWPKIVIGAFCVFLVYLVFSSFSEKDQTYYNYYTKHDNLYPDHIHSHFVELANGGGVLIR